MSVVVRVVRCVLSPPCSGRGRREEYGERPGRCLVPDLNQGTWRRCECCRGDNNCAKGQYSSMSNLEQMASLLAERNPIDEKIGALIGRPAGRGCVGEWIAQEIFGVTLEEDAAKRCIDGCFTDGPLAGKTVNVKWYGKREGLLDINPACFPDGLPACLDYYLVMTGPKAPAVAARGQTRPWVITEVFLFDAPALVEQVRKQKRRLGVATGVRKNEWEAAMVYPEAARSARLTLNDAQREALKLFAETS